MIVLIIMGVIASFAYPSYKQQVYKSHRIDAQALLLDAMARQQRHHSELNLYTLAPAELGYTDTNGNYLSKEGWYALSMAECPDPDDDLAFCVALTATPQGDQANDSQCMTFNYNSQAKKGITGAADAATCW